LLGRAAREAGKAAKKAASADEEGPLDPRAEKWDGRDEPSGDQPA
jgi:hypothetical protein